MPIFDKREDKPKTREVLDIVFDMLSSDVPEDKIISMLKQMGMGDEEAKQTLSAAKQKFEALVQSSLSAAVDKLLAKEKEDLLARVDSKADAMKRDLLLKLDIRAQEDKKYVDQKADSVGAEISGLKGDLFSTKVEFNTRLRTLEDKTGQQQKKASEAILPLLLMIVGIVIMFYGAAQLRDLIFAFTMAQLGSVLLYFNVMIVGIAFILVGFQKYPREAKEFTSVGLEYVK
jgi:hypothetical protein